MKKRAATGHRGLTYAQNRAAFTACYRNSEKSVIYFYIDDFIAFSWLPLFWARYEKALKRAGLARFTTRDSQTYPQKMCTTENSLTS
ncbi:MAG: hypothetical protein LBI62_07790 [Candidatus Accumulibacter sp.]|nr:hypothetical protein [Accumulibacter sp.]